MKRYSKNRVLTKSSNVSRAYTCARETVDKAKILLWLRGIEAELSEPAYRLAYSKINSNKYGENVNSDFGYIEDAAYDIRRLIRKIENNEL